MIPFPDKKYDVIYADPPWPMKKIRRKVRPNQIEMDYPIMSISDIRDLPIKQLGQPDSTLWLWTTHRFLLEALKCMELWGYRYQRLITWDKQNGMCLYGFHHRTELLLFGYRGRLQTFPKRSAFPTVVQAKSERHSAKPDVIKTLIEPFGSQRIELFARKVTPGWDAWGNEVPNCNLHNPPPYASIQESATLLGDSPGCVKRAIQKYAYPSGS